MSWVKLDDGFPEHPKVSKVGMEGLALHVVAICYSARNLTDGHIPSGTVRFLAGLPEKRAKVLAQSMVKAGLWDPCGDDFQVHDYLEYNPSRAAVLEKRQKDMKRKGYGNA